MKRYIGVDLHKNTFTVCYLSRKGKELKSFKVSKEGIEAFKQTLTRDDEVAVESTGNTGYFVREIKDRVGGVKIINPMSCASQALLHKNTFLIPLLYSFAKQLLIHYELIQFLKAALSKE